MATALAPVIDALDESGRRRAQAASAAAEQEVRAELARAHGEAERVLGQARSDGSRAAGQRAAMQLAEAHREARQAVLAARRAAYETARRRALEALEQQGTAPAGRHLGDLLERLARERIGDAPSVRRVGPGRLGVLATSRHRRAAIGPAQLVDWALQALSAEVESLWA